MDSTTETKANASDRIAQTRRLHRWMIAVGAVVALVALVMITLAFDATRERRSRADAAERVTRAARAVDRGDVVRAVELTPNDVSAGDAWELRWLHRRVYPAATQLSVDGASVVASGAGGLAWWGDGALRILDDNDELQTRALAGVRELWWRGAHVVARTDQGITELRQGYPPKMTPLDGEIRDAAPFRGGKSVVLLRYPDELELLDLDGQRAPLWVPLEDLSGEPLRVAAASDGRIVAVLDERGTVHGISPDLGRITWRAQLPQDCIVEAMTFDAFGGLWIAGGVGTTGRLWRISEVDAHITSQTLPQRLTALTITPHGTVVVADIHGRTTFVDPSGSTDVRTTHGHSDRVLALTVRASGELVTAGGDGVRAWGADTAPARGKLSQDQVNAFTERPWLGESERVAWDGADGVASCFAGVLRVWGARDQLQRAVPERFAEPDDRCVGLGQLANGAWCVVSGNQLSTALWCDGKERWRVERKVDAAAIGPSGTVLSLESGVLVARDPSDGDVLSERRWSADRDPVDVAVDAAGDRGFVLDADGLTVVRIDTLETAGELDVPARGAHISQAADQIDVVDERGSVWRWAPRFARSRAIVAPRALVDSRVAYGQVANYYRDFRRQREVQAAIERAVSAGISVPPIRRGASLRTYVEAGLLERPGGPAAGEYHLDAEKRVYNTLYGSVTAPRDPPAAIAAAAVNRAPGASTADDEIAWERMRIAARSVSDSVIRETLLSEPTASLADWELGLDAMSLATFIALWPRIAHRVERTRDPWIWDAALARLEDARQAGLVIDDEPTLAFIATVRERGDLAQRDRAASLARVSVRQ